LFVDSDQLPVNLLLTVVAVSILLNFLIVSIIFLSIKRIYIPYIDSITLYLQKLTKGESPSWITPKTEETRELNYLLNKLTLQKKKEIEFARAIAKGNYTIPFIPLSQWDELGNALVNMRNSLMELEIKKEQKYYRIRQEELAKVNHQLERFLYATSHDMRAPLTTLLGLIGLTKKENDTDNIRSLANMMEIPIQKLDCVLKQVSIFSKNINEQIWIEPIFITDLISQVWQDLKDHKNFSKINFEIEPQTEITLYSDPVRVSNVLKQVLKNALDYLDNSKTQSFLKVQIHLNKDYMIIECKDNGLGVDKNYIDRIFSMFFRASEKSIGPGLGLYLAKEILTKLNSFIYLDSELGFGTIVRIEIKNEKTTFINIKNHLTIETQPKILSVVTS